MKKFSQKKDKEQVNLSSQKKENIEDFDNELFKQIDVSAKKNSDNLSNDIKTEDERKDSKEKKGIKKGYINNKVQKKGTQEYNNKGTKKGTLEIQKSVTENKNSHKSPEEIEIYLDSKTTNYISDIEKLNNSFIYTNLSGIPKRLVDVIFSICQEHMSKETPPITFQTLVYLCNAKKNSVKVARKRLKEKKILFTKKSKETPNGGRVSSVIYILSDEVISDIIRNRKIKESTEQGTKIGYNDLSSSYKLNNKNTTTNIDDSWKKIKLENIRMAFGQMKILRKQFFGRTQLNVIYKQSGTILSAQQVQESIDHFAFGLRHLIHKQPYSMMKNPGAILVEHLKNGDAWQEPNYLTPEQEQMIGIYKNIRKKIIEDMKIYFIKWLETDKEEKYKYYQSKLSSTSYYSDQIFKEMAYEDYTKNHWKSECLNKISTLLGEDHKKTLDKIENIFFSEEDR